ncbi:MULTISPECIES: hypothetical protein [unclassified Rhodococcus (in: high G+C Gram-positive bacteria)]|uniref:hypothetical protein n=1 Tax=unclassified Rhodococcus (in: high G+C Gram-positive bacteria) TaxID=192944 RepID=UPI000BE33C7D|nr:MULTISPECIES: hypothetical protein [unclassified Rhodococcus (in: high G+C Gram-positive bacteria)]
MKELRVTVGRWEARGPWWQGRRRMPGLFLEIEGHGATQTYGTRSLDTAREMVLEYLECTGNPAPADTTITWIDRAAPATD